MNNTIKYTCNVHGINNGQLIENYNPLNNFILYLPLKIQPNKLILEIIDKMNTNYNESPLIFSDDLIKKSRINITHCGGSRNSYKFIDKINYKLFDKRIIELSNMYSVGVNLYFDNSLIIVKFISENENASYVFCSRDDSLGNIKKYLRKFSIIYKKMFDEKGNCLDNSVIINSIQTNNSMVIIRKQLKIDLSKTKIKDLNIDASLYLLQEREHFNAKDNVYKIGKTKQEIGKRISSYPKGSNLILTLGISKLLLDEAEKELIKIFTGKYKLRNEIGSEYFEGDKFDMMKVIFDYVIGKTKIN